MFFFVNNAEELHTLHRPTGPGFTVVRTLLSMKHLAVGSYSCILVIDAKDVNLYKLFIV